MIGGYHLHELYLNSKTHPSLLRLVTSFSPDEAVSRMKEILIKQQKSLSESNNSSVLSEEQSSLSISGDNQHVTEDIEIFRDDSDHITENTEVSNDDNDPVTENIEVSNNDNHQINVLSTPCNVNGTFRRETLTNKARANLLNEQNLVDFNVKSKVFTVRSLDGQLVHAVHMNDTKRLFRCSCPSMTQSCQHVLAVKVYLGFV